MHYYQFNISDYQSHTKHLTPIEDICYRRLLDWQYLHEKPIPGDIKSTCRLLMLRDYQEDVEQILNEFFVLTEDGWINPRAFEDIEEFLDYEEKNKTKEENEKERKRRHREERKKLFADLREKGIIPGWRILTEPLRELHRQYCKTTVTTKEQTCDVPMTEPERVCDEPGTAITTNQQLLTINQEPIKPREGVNTTLCSEKTEKPVADAPLAQKPFSPVNLNQQTHIQQPFRPNVVAVRLAEKHELDVGKEADLFVAHYEATGEVRADWQAQFRKWLLKSFQYKSDTEKRAQYPPSGNRNGHKKFDSADYNRGNDGYGNPRENNNIIDINEIVVNKRPAIQRPITY